MFRFLKFLETGGVYYAKGDQEATMGDIKKQRSASASSYDPYLNQTKRNIGSQTSIDPNTGLTTPGSGLMGQQESQLNDLTPRLKNFASTGGISDQSRSALGNNPNSIANSIETPDYSYPNAGYKDFSSTGGVDLSRPTQTFGDMQDVNSDSYSGMNSSIKGLQGIGATGGMTAEQSGQLGKTAGFYGNLMDTGGYSTEDIANIKNESNSVIPSYFSSLKDSLDQRRAASGYGPGFSDANVALAREGAIASGDQSVRTNIGIQDAVRSGKMAGAGGLSNQVLSQYGIEAPLKERAFEASGNMSAQMQQIRLAAAQGDVNAQRIIQSGKLEGLGGLSANIGARGQFGLAKGQLAQQGQESLMGAEQSGEEFGMSGLSHLYDSSTNQLTEQQRQYLTAIGMSNDDQDKLLALQQQQGTLPGRTATGWGNVMRGVGAVAGGMTGLGGLMSAVR